MKVLFIDDCNKNESANPKVILVDVFTNLPVEFVNHLFNVLEEKQQGVEREGGSWHRILINSQLEFDIVFTGIHSEFKDWNKVDLIYIVISGNY